MLVVKAVPNGEQQFCNTLNIMILYFIYVLVIKSDCLSISYSNSADITVQQHLGLCLSMFVSDMFVSVCAFVLGTF